MTRSRRQWPLISLLVSLSLVLAACGGGSGSKGDAGAPDGGDELSGTLNASGATFPLAFYEEAIAAYSDEHPDVTINYGGGGSGKGRQDFADGVVDFAGSDGLVKPEDAAKFKGAFLYFPTVAAPITVSYNLPAVKDLRLTAATVAKIFQREITTWDDAAIATDNPNATLPKTAITLAHRADSSGTTENFTKFLKAAAPGWKLDAGSTVDWPKDAQAGNGNNGVAQIVKSTEGAVGYVDLSDAVAAALQTAKLQNKAGTFVAPTLEGAQAALAGAAVNDDLSYNPIWADGKDAYPITAPTWILAYKQQSDAAKAKVLKAFLRYVLTDGQDLAADVDYAKLPQALRQKAIAQIDELEIPSS